MTLREDFEDLQKKAQDVENSLAMEILHDYKLVNRRLFIIIILLILSLLGSVGYTIYLLNDISTVETVDVQQENESGDNNYIGNDGDINGKAKD